MDIIRKIYFLLTPAEQKSALLILGLMLIGMVLETMGIGLVVPAISLLTQPNIATSYPVLKPFLIALGHPSQTQLVVGGLFAFVTVYFVKAIFLAFFAWRQSCFAFGVQAQLSQKLFATYLCQPYTFHLQHNSAQLIRNVTSEVNIFTNSALFSGMALITEGLVLVGIAILLFIVEPMGASIVIFVLGCASWLFHRNTRKRITRWGVTRQHHEGLRIQHLQQGLGGVKDVKFLGREKDFLQQYELHNTQSARVGQYQGTLLQLPRLWLEFLAVFGMAILIFSMLVQGYDTVDIVPMIGLFAIAAFRLMPSVSRILTAIQSIRYGMPVINMLHEELALGVPDMSDQESELKLTFRSDLSLENVSYIYPGSTVRSLNGLNINIEKGECVGIIGTSGAGKSTLVDVILGLLSPNEGKIKVDGQDIQENLRNWQNQIGYVPQSIYLTDDTIRRNVALGVPDEKIDEVSVERAISEAQLEDFVTSLPDGINTMVGERGIRLSGGQRQRIGIARALYHDPSVLVLDEATSALDADTETSVMQAIAALQHKKTLVLIAHRLTTLKNCTQIVELCDGSVKRIGTYQDVITQAARVSQESKEGKFYA